MREFDVDAAPCAAGARRRPRETAGQPWNDNTRSQPWQRLAISRAPVFRVRRSSLSSESKVSITGVPIMRPLLSTGGWRLRAGSTSRVACTAKALALCPVESASKSGGRAVALQAAAHHVQCAAHGAFIELAHHTHARGQTTTGLSAYVTHWHPGSDSNDQGARKLSRTALRRRCEERSCIPLTRVRSTVHM